MRDEHAFVVLAYGASPFLRGCLAGLRAQTRPSRIVVSTSTPSPFVAEAARWYGAELKLNPERRGIASDWNFALTASDARYVTLAHQDDVYAPAFAERTMALFGAHPQGSLCFTSQDEIDDEGRVRPSRISRVQHLIEAATLGRREFAGAGLRMRLFLSFGNPLACSSVTFDRAKLADFRFSDGFASNLDWEAWWRLLGERHGFLHDPERLVLRRRNALTETSRQIALGGRAREDAAMFSRIWPKPIDRALTALYASSYR